ncbi:MAG TPA: BRCT domain-containing protein, partial [Clostridia bacterium]|nr:BRCT domain-containing protein [Clostridia bacterium]
FKTLDKLIKADVDTLLELDDFGQIMADNVVNFFKDEKNIEIVNKLLDAGITIKVEKEKVGTFSGKNVVLTGSLSNYKRGQASKLIVDAGGKISDTVSKAVNLVIAGEEAGSKLEKAKKLGIEIWDEAQFLQSLGDNA